LDAARKLDPKKAMEWAKIVFDNSGGSKAIFQKLENDIGRPELLGQLRVLALTKLPTAGTGQNNPLIKALSEMDQSQRRSIFQNCLDMAMPWVEANLEGFWTVNPDQYSCVIGIEDADLFEKKFGDEFRRCTPAQARMATNTIFFYKTGVTGKLTCYVELSGVPLPALNLLSTWHDSYAEEGNKVPVHTHKDKTLFVHPMAPTSAKLDRLAEHFKLYIQGILLGVLKPRVDAPDERFYCLIVSGEELSIGNERTIRMEGIASEHLGDLQKKISQALDQIKTTAQYAGLAALYDFYEKCVYPPGVVKNENHVEKFAKGFCNTMCANLAEEARKIIKKKPSVSGFNTNEFIGLLKGAEDEDRWDDFEGLDIWTEEIKGSYADVYENEVGKSHLSKRMLKREFFQPGWLEDRFSDKGEVSASPIPKGFMPYKVAVEGKSSGPFDWAQLFDLVSKGKLAPSTKVWRRPMTQWQKAEEIKELSALFSTDEPALIDDSEPTL
jgi:hypothetical protein